MSSDKQFEDAINAFFTPSQMTIPRIVGEFSRLNLHQIARDRAAVKQKQATQCIAEKDYVESVKSKEQDALSRTLSSRTNLSSLASFSGLDSTHSSICSNRTLIEEFPVKESVSGYVDSEVFANVVEHRKDLPIFNSRSFIVESIVNNPVVIISGQTGCGKSTQVPQYILDYCKIIDQPCNILVSQPRKIAAITIAQRVANERDSIVGKQIGYQVGLSKASTSMVPDRANDSDGESLDIDDTDVTQILYCTTGVILQKLIASKSMSHYTHIILDEVHDRDIDMDFLLAVIRRFLANGSHTKIVLMSATMNTKKFENYFTVPLKDGITFTPPLIDLNSEPRKHQIVELFLEDLEKYSKLRTLDIVKYEEPGISTEMIAFASKIIYIILRRIQKTKASNILVFLPGLYEIECLEKELKMNGSRTDMAVLYDLVDIVILHSSISVKEQANAFKENSKRLKIILSTNIAESSVTIPNVASVIDFCLTKYQTCVNGSQMSGLVTEWTSRNSCKQRAGRVGRTCNGTVYRMIHKPFYEKKMLEHPIPEMMRIPLESVVIKTKMLEMGKPLEILALAMDPPPYKMIVAAVLQLKELGALLSYDQMEKFDYEDGELSYIGRIMAALPVDVRISKFIVLGYMFSVLEEAIIIGAGFSLKSIFAQSYRKKMDSYNQKLNWADGSGCDNIAILNAYKLWMHNKNASIFLTANAEQIWCDGYGLVMKNLHEMELLVKEIWSRLERLNLKSLPEAIVPKWQKRDKNFILKICFAGAWGAPNFFMSMRNNYDTERSACTAIKQFNIYRSVYFKGMDRRIIGDVYEENLKKILAERGVCSDSKKIQVLFDYMTSEHVYVQFDEEDDIENDEERADKNFVGRIPSSVYRAVKMRLLEGKSKLQVMGEAQTVQYAIEKKLGVMVDGSFEMTKHFIKNPELCILPPSAVVKVTGYVTSVQSCSKFFFRPMIAFTKSKTFFEYGEIQDKMQSLMEAIVSKTKCVISLIEFKDKMMVIVKGNDESLERGIIHMSQQNTVHLSNNRALVTLIDDERNTEVAFEKIFIVQSPDDIGKLFVYPPRCFECTLTEVQPSFSGSHTSKWTKEAVERFKTAVASECRIDVFSIVDDVVHVKLWANNECLNSQLIEWGFGQECEETFFSKNDHERRKRFCISYPNKYAPQEEFAKKIDKNSVADRNIQPPPMSFCRQVMTLLGPYSPLETTLYGITRDAGNRISIEPTSVNHVILNDYKNINEQFFIAADLTQNRNRMITLRQTTAMPNIPGLAALLAMIFSPHCELRRNKDKTQFISLLCGLGLDKERQQPIYGNHDCVLDINFKLTDGDTATINHLRYRMSQLLLTRPDEELPNLTDGEKGSVMKRIQGLVTEIFDKHRPIREARRPDLAFDWNMDQENATKLTDPNGWRSIYNMIAIPEIIGMSDEAHAAMMKHIQDLEKCAANQVTLYSLVCNLCNVTWATNDELCQHLISTKHTSLKSQLMADM